MSFPRLSGRALLHLACVVAGTLAVNLLLLIGSGLLTHERAIGRDISAPIAVDLIQLPPPEPPQQEPKQEVKKPKPRPRMDFQPELSPPSFDNPEMATVTINVSPGLGIGASEANPLIFSETDLDQAPQAVIRTPPAYPYRARQRSINGYVKIKLLVNKDGSVGNVEILEASPAGYFEESVKQTVPQWRFNPGQIAGEPVNSWVITSVRFDLDG
jgi:protein TonB